MRIAQVAPLFESVPPKLYGGTERVVSWLTEELVRMGHEVTLFASGDSLTQARLVPICDESLRLSKNCKDQLAQHILQIERVLQERNNFDIVHFHTDYLHYPVTRNARLISLTTLHGRLDLPELAPLYQEFRDVPLASISDAQRAPLPFARWLGTVHHGLPLRLYEPYLETGKYLAFLGRISPEKGVDEAIAIARRTGIPLKIAAKVDSADAEYYETVIKPHLDHPLIEFVGEIGFGEKNNFLGKALALLFPIAWPEPFGLVMIEAMACGTPVIAYPRGSVPEVMADGISGRVVRDQDEAVAAVATIGSISRRQCRAYYEERFSSARMTADYLALYERLVSEDSESISMAHGVPVG